MQGVKYIIPIFFYLSLDQKQLSFGVIARSQLVDLSSSSIDELSVSFRGEKIGQIESLTLRFENSGNRPIEPRDFERAMRVSLPENSRILSASLSDNAPKGLKPNIVTEASGFSVEPLLLNPGDNFSVSLIVSGKSGVPEFNARISGIREVTPIKQNPPRPIDMPPGPRIATVIFGFVAVLNFLYLMGLHRFDVSGPKVVPAFDTKLLTLGSGLIASLMAGVATLAAFLEVSPSPFQLAISIGVIFLICSPAFFLARRRVQAAS